MDNKVKNAFLSGIFRLKGNFAGGVLPADRTFGEVEITPFFGGARASGTVSADFELEWAFRGLSLDQQQLMGIRTRANMSKLLRILDRESVPITWATVGHLFLESCERSDCGLAHESMPRPPYNPHWEGDWYMHDPCSNLEKAPGWYAPDLIREIMSSRVQHEIGSHSFSHIDFSSETSSRVLVQRELEECTSAMAPFKIRPMSLVYPRNVMGHEYLDLIGSANITAVRHRDTKIKLSYPEKTLFGVYKLYESMNLRVGRGYNYIEKAKLFLDEAIRRGAAYHFWFHPSDPAELIEGEFADIIHYLAVLRDRGEVWVATMNELVAYCEAREQSKLNVRRTNGMLKIGIECDFDSTRYGETQLTLRLTSDCAPKQSRLTSLGHQESILWRADPVRPASNQDQVAYLVEVPAVDGEITVEF